MAEETSQSDRLALTANIVMSHVSHNPVPAAELTKLIRDVYEALSTVERPAESTRPEPAVPVKKSVTPDYIFCLEDGKKLKMLKRHLKTSYDMTPDEYRERWGLASDYPMVAPSYAKKRSSLARKIGLGTRRKKNNGSKN